MRDSAYDMCEGRCFGRREADKDGVLSLSPGGCGSCCSCCACLCNASSSVQLAAEVLQVVSSSAPESPSEHSEKLTQPQDCRVSFNASIVFGNGATMSSPSFSPSVPSSIDTKDKFVFVASFGRPTSDFEKAAFERFVPENV